MKVKMKVRITGTRDGVDWPHIGAELEVPDDEGANLCANKMAEPVVELDADVEAAVAAPVQTRGGTKGK